MLLYHYLLHVIIEYFIGVAIEISKCILMTLYEVW